MRAQIVIRGGRDLTDQIASNEKENLARGQDIAISVRDKDGKVQRIPNVVSMVIRVEGRKAIATCEIEVDDMDLTAVWINEIRGVSR